jgi:hypothetical protein
MALTEWNATEPAFDPARDIAARTLTLAVPQDALDRLPGLYREQAPARCGPESGGKGLPLPSPFKST